MTSDPVNQPTHYRQHPSGHEVIEATENLSFTMGNALKYAMRAPYKGRALEDWQKCAWYLRRELDWMERHPIQAFFSKLAGFIFLHRDAVLDNMFAAETDPVVCLVISACQTNFEMDIDHALAAVESKVGSLEEYPVEVLHA